jgi:hypothetical protein
MPLVLGRRIKEPLEQDAGSFQLCRTVKEDL